MSLEYFEGPAGSGKTYQLMESLKTALQNRPLSDGEAVLALTYMHGSRRRIHNRLSKIAPLRGRFLACTVDSFARRIICRWRSIAKTIDPSIEINNSEDFTNICRIAALIMSRPDVSKWLKVHYPVALVDELQDCKGDHLSIIQSIETCCHIFAAADEFQDLQETSINPAVQWHKNSQELQVNQIASEEPP